MRSKINAVGKAIFLGLVILLTLVSAISCVVPAAGPQVMVTRVPVTLSGGAGLAVKAASPAEAGAEAAPARPVPAAAQPSLDSAGGSDRPAPAGRLAASTEINPTPEPGQPPLASAPVIAAEPGQRPLQQTHNILLLGTDQRRINYVGRTDTIMILAVDKDNGRAALVSIPRDTYLPIPGIGYNRINTAYANGEVVRPGSGLPLLITTIEKNFDIPIDNYVRIDFSGFEKVVDALGGVDLKVDCPIYDELVERYFETPYLEPGEYHMNGAQALLYARARKTTNDLERARRQQRVILALRDHALTGGWLSRIPALWTALRDSVDTDLSLPELLELASFGATLDMDHVSGLVIGPPMLTGWITPQGAQVKLPDFPAIAAELDRIWEREPLMKTNADDAICKQ